MLTPLIPLEFGMSSITLLAMPSNILQKAKLESIFITNIKKATFK